MFKFQDSPASIVASRRFQTPKFGQLAMAAMILIGATLATGCSTLPNSLSNGFASDSSIPPAASQSQAQYLVDMQLSYGGSKKFKGDIGQGATVQTALEASGATKKFRKMDVAVMRKVEGNFNPLKMSSDYNSSKKRIRPETDYALRHGDRIVITPKSENQLLQLLGSFAEVK